MTSGGSLELLDWRRQVGELYARVRAAASSPELAHLVWREGRDRLFAEHPQSPLAPDDDRRRTGLAIGDYDPTMRFTVPLEPAERGAAGEPEELRTRTGTDGEVSFFRMGTVTLPVGRLDVWWLGGYGGGVWVPVRDAGSGRLSYGGGRYLLDTVKGADLGSGPGEELVLDLNFLYSPSCAYDESWACPLAPLGNRLDVELAVGELSSH